MAYSTTERLPTIVTVSAAEKKFNGVTPIRGSVDPQNPNGVRPLASRRDKHLRIDKKVDEYSNPYYELICYDSPVITLRKHPTNMNTIVTVRPYYIGSYTCDFIRSVMWVGANRPELNIRNRQIIMTLPATINSSPPDGKRKYAMSAETEISFEFDEVNKQFELYNADNAYAWAPNKKKLAQLSAPYKEFADYFAGFVSLLTQDVDAEDIGDDPFAAKRQIVVQPQTLIDMFGLKERDDSPYLSRLQFDEIDLTPWTGLLSKPTWVMHEHVLNHDPQTNKYHALNVWNASVANFLTLVRSDQPQETKTDNFYKGALVLICANHMRNRSGVHINKNNPKSFTLSRTTADGLVRELFLQVFGDEVMERKEYPLGRVPTTNYGKYLFGRKKSGNT